MINTATGAIVGHISMPGRESITIYLARSPANSIIPFAEAPPPDRSKWIDGRRFGLPQGHFVGPGRRDFARGVCASVCSSIGSVSGGFVYNNAGQHVGRLEGWKDDMSKAPPPLETKQGALQHALSPVPT